MKNKTFGVSKCDKKYRQNMVSKNKNVVMSYSANMQDTRLEKRFWGAYVARCRQP